MVTQYCDKCCEGDTSSQWERANLPHSPHPHPLTGWKMQEWSKQQSTFRQFALFIENGISDTCCFRGVIMCTYNCS